MSLAITEKREQQRQRPSGCVGIFLQFLDWNRRFAKKKLFSKKLLPPAHAARRASKKFCTDDKMPMAKLLLIAEENRGGFPSKKKLDADIGNAVQTPGLVARLMGLESMPVSVNERPRKAIGCNLVYEGDEELRSGTSGFGKTESRPQKLRKTEELLQRQPVKHDGRVRPNVFGKNVTSSCSSINHHKLMSPVKSPRLLSGSHRARLMQAATKILEPGSQPRNRAKCSIAYVVPSPPGAEATAAAATCLKRSKEPLSDFEFRSCMGYGSLVEMPGLGTHEREPFTTRFGSSAFQFSIASSSRQDSMEKNTMSLLTLAEQKSKLNPAVQSQINVQNNACDDFERKQHLQNHRNVCKLKPDNITPKVNNLRHNQAAMLREKAAEQMTYGATACSRKQSRSDFTELKGHQGFSAIGTTMKEPRCMTSIGEVMNNHRVQLGRNCWGKNISCKRKSISFHNDDFVVFGPAFVRESSNERDLLSGSKTGVPINQPICRRCVERSLTKEKKETDNFRGWYSEMASFTFKSPMRKSANSSSHEELAEKCRNRYQLNARLSAREKLLSDSINTNPVFQRRTRLEGEEISRPIEKRIREDAQPNASILEELMISLKTGTRTADQNGSSKTEGLYSLHTNLSDFSVPKQKLCNIQTEAQEKAKFETSAGLMYDQTSPVSILEASISNDSCSYVSIHASSVSANQSRFSLTENQCTEPSLDMDIDLLDSANQSRFSLTENQCTEPSLDMDIDLLDSATSSGIMESVIGKIQHSTDNMLSKSSIHSSEAGISGTKLCEARRTISNSETTFMNFALYASVWIADFVLESILLDVLEAIIGSSEDQKITSGDKDAKGKYQLKKCLFDCMIQSLDSKCKHFGKNGKSLRTPFSLTEDLLIREVHEEIRGWVNLSGKFLDDLIQEEMKNSTAIWKTCGIEVFEAGNAIEGHILQALVNETMTDFCNG
ncbi:unnamed protein product [Musa acuminata subsp. malaccensis]|uniref:(wild Malaysian banana) hypothetical protein n=1 Tax=Musa acuminata subsp. malaccensis TaxID=214687 RepID=A0A804K826_MUSAM|nr:unnamed protein product [Musa acuminata subsp. malaccensis]